jgi:hypothetical protein
MGCETSAPLAPPGRLVLVRLITPWQVSVTWSVNAVILPFASWVSGSIARDFDFIEGLVTTLTPAWRTCSPGRYLSGARPPVEGSADGADYHHKRNARAQSVMRGCLS